MSETHHHGVGNCAHRITPLTVLILLSSFVWIASVNGSPAKFESNDTPPFPLELQPPLVDDADDVTFDSYGNPIDTLKPIDTPDGRKVISAQGVQFEIPTYASGITELKKPADDLLPPHIGELNSKYLYEINDSDDDDDNNHNNKNNKRNNDHKQIIVENEQYSYNNDDDDHNDYKAGGEVFKGNNNNDNEAIDTVKSSVNDDNDGTTNAEKAHKTLGNYSNCKKNIQNYAPFPHSLQPLEPLLETIRASLVHLPHVYTTSQPLPLLNQNKRSQNAPSNQTSNTNNNQIQKSNLYDKSISISTSSLLKPALSLSNHMLPPIPLSYISSLSNNPQTNSPVRSGLPLSNGNFNYPNIPQDLDTINRLAAKYKNPILPNIDPIAVALSTADESVTASLQTSISQQAQFASTATAASTSTASSSYTSSSTSPGKSSTVEIEQANLVKLNNQQQRQGGSTETVTLPDYILAFNDPDIAGPVPWTPSPNGESLKVIAWDLLPPNQDVQQPDQQPEAQEPTIITHDHQVPPKRVQGVEDPVTHNIHFSLSTGPSGLGQISDVNTNAGQVSVVVVDAGNEDDTHGHGTNAHVGGTTSRLPNRTHNRGSAHYSTTTTTPRSTTTRATTTTTTTTTTRRPTMTTTTTTRRPPTKRTTTATTTTTTSRPPSTPLTTYAPFVGAWDANTLPPWLDGVTDPELDVAVTFIVPVDNDQYNHTLERDLEPPFEPFVDVKDIHLTPPPPGAATKITGITPRTTTTTTTPRITTKRPTTSTTKYTTTSPPTISTTSTTTTRRPTISTTRAYWVRANPTSSTTTTTTTTTTAIIQPTHELNNRFNSPNHQAPNHIKQLNAPQKTSVTTSTASNTGAVDTDATTNWQAGGQDTLHGTSTNQNTVVTTSPITTTITDPITSAEAGDKTSAGTNAEYKPQGLQNPFLPKPFERQPVAAAATVTHGTAPPRSTTTTTTSSTTARYTTVAPIAVEKNPFEATLPPWLKDFDYPDVGPGVPYDPKNFEDDNRDTITTNNNNDPIQSFKPIQSPKGFAHQTTATITTTTSSPPSNFGFTPTISSTAFPSKVTLPLPSINQAKEDDYQQQQPPNDDEPTRVLIPPAQQVEQDDNTHNSNNNAGFNNNNNNFNERKHNAIASPTSTHYQIPTSSRTPTSNTNFAARLEPQTESSVQAIGISEESFPPFYGNDVATQKFEYTKSDEGKVITTPVLAQRKDTNTNSVFNGFGGATESSSTFSATSQASFSTFGSTTSTTATNSFGISDVPVRPAISATGKYTGGFGAPPGLLKPKQPNSDGSSIYVAGDTHDFSKNIKTTLKPSLQGKYTGGFGAPSGVLSPNEQGDFRPYQQQTQTYTQVQTQQRFNNDAPPQLIPAASTVSVNPHQGRFGGPPGILVPFDNAQ